MIFYICHDVATCVNESRASDSGRMRRDLKLWKDMENDEPVERELLE